jgi:hypothetical protein
MWGFDFPESGRPEILGERQFPTLSRHSNIKHQVLFGAQRNRKR